MTKKPKLVAAGGVVLRGDADSPKVLLVHRPRYDDWSLPKGKRHPDELTPVTALREIEEESGVLAALDLRLPSMRYPVGEKRKVVHYWRARVRRKSTFKPNKEVDRIAWLPAAKVFKAMSYDEEKEIVDAALSQPDTVALLLVRHAKAMLRKNWSGDDNKRHLTGRGRSQAKALYELLASYQVERLISSSARRCMETLAPYSKKSGIEIEPVDLLRELDGTTDPKAVTRYLTKIQRKLSVATAVCGHRPVLPSMYEGLGLPSRKMVTAEVLVLHMARKGVLVHSEIIKPTL